MIGKLQANVNPVVCMVNQVDCVKEALDYVFSKEHVWIFGTVASIIKHSNFITDFITQIV